MHQMPWVGEIFSSGVNALVIAEGEILRPANRFESLALSSRQTVKDMCEWPLLTVWQMADRLER